MFLNWLENRQGNTFESLTLEQLERIVLSHVRITLNEPDAQLRVICLFADYKTMLRSRKWDKLIEEKPKVTISHLIILLKPEPLRVKIENDLQFSKRELRKDWKGFYKICCPTSCILRIFRACAPL